MTAEKEGSGTGHGLRRIQRQLLGHKEGDVMEPSTGVPGRRVSSAAGPSWRSKASGRASRAAWVVALALVAIAALALDAQDRPASAQAFGSGSGSCTSSTA